MILVFWWRIQQRFERLKCGFSWFFFVSRVFYFAEAATIKKRR
jgi:hypothetical protein